MTSSKRRIPINNHAPSQEAPPEAVQAEDKGVAGGSQAAEGRPKGSQGEGSPAEDQASTEAANLETITPSADDALEDVTGERDALADALLRLRAEFDNFRRRAAREMGQARDRAQGELLAELLPVLDNLERALDAAEHHEEGKVLAGVRMTRDMFIDLLKRAGVEEIGTIGAEFDPAVHDAMLMEPSESDEGTVTAVLERGYRKGEHILRPARVAVSAGPGQAAPAE
jgi:molecular chaperone GrpE